jgi:uncharacterized membrane protein
MAMAVGGVLTGVLTGLVLVLITVTAVWLLPATDRTDGSARRVRAARQVALILGIILIASTAYGLVRYGLPAY